MAALTKTPSGTWKATIRRVGWPTVAKTFRTKRDAEDWARRTEDEMVRGVFIQRAPSEKTTVADALDRYEREIVPTKKTSTQRRESRQGCRRNRQGQSREHRGYRQGTNRADDGQQNRIGNFEQERRRHRRRTEFRRRQSRWGPAKCDGRHYHERRGSRVREQATPNARRCLESAPTGGNLPGRRRP
nr:MULTISPECIES: hypothetical protein [Burkholderia]